MVVVLPLTTNLDRSGFEYTLLIYPDRNNGLPKESIALIFQIKSLDRKRFTSRQGVISPDDLKAVDLILRTCSKYHNVLCIIRSIDGY